MSVGRCAARNGRGVDLRWVRMGVSTWPHSAKPFSIAHSDFARQKRVVEMAVVVSELNQPYTRSTVGETQTGTK